MQKIWKFSAFSLEFKSFSWSLEQFFLTVGQNNFGNKIPFSPFFKYFVRCVTRGKTKDLRKTFFNAENQAGYLTWPIFFHELYLVKEPICYTIFEPYLFKANHQSCKMKTKSGIFYSLFFESNLSSSTADFCIINFILIKDLYQVY